MIYLFRGGKGDLSIVERPLAPHLNVQMFTSTLEKIILLHLKSKEKSKSFSPISGGRGDLDQTTQY